MMHEPKRYLCHACHRAGTAECDLTFVCRTCHKEHSVCAFLPGGFDAYKNDGGIRKGLGECSLCQETRTMSQKWIDRWHRKVKSEAG